MLLDIKNIDVLYDVSQANWNFSNNVKKRDAVAWLH